LKKKRGILFGVVFICVLFFVIVFFVRNKESAEPVSKSDFKLNTVVTVTIYDLEEKEKREDKILDLIVLKELLETLDEEEKQLIFLRYFADRTQSDVGKIMGISQVQVSRSEKRIIEKLRKKGGR